MWKTIKPWITVLVIFMILRYTGALAGISALANRAILATSILDANPNDHDTSANEKLDFNFFIYDLEGHKVDFKTFQGKPIFLNLWATWCGPCRAEMPSIQKLYNSINKDSVTFIMLSLDNPAQVEKVKNYVDSKAFSFPIYIAGELPPQLQVSSIPTTFVIGADGTLAFKKTGMAEYHTNKFKKFLERLYASPQ